MRFHFRSLGRTGAGVYGHNTEVNTGMRSAGTRAGHEQALSRVETSDRDMLFRFNSNDPTP